MSETELFIEYWRANSDIEVQSEFRPQKLLYEKSDKKLKYRAWLDYNRLGDYRADFCLVFGDRGIMVEFDGSFGQFSHKGNNAERDRKKAIQMAKLGFITIRFSVQTLKSNHKYVFDEIMAVKNKWFS